MVPSRSPLSLPVSTLPVSFPYIGRVQASHGFGCSQPTQAFQLLLLTRGTTEPEAAACALFVCQAVLAISVQSPVVAPFLARSLLVDAIVSHSSVT